MSLKELPYASTLIVVPAFNEAPRIGRVIANIQRQGPWPVLVVDDGSYDDTASKAIGAGAMVAKHAINRGPGAATMTGMAYARRHGYRFVITIDGDDQHDPADFPALMAPLLREEADIVIGNRFMKGTNAIPRSRVWYNGIANLTTFLFSRYWVSDTQSGLKAFGPRAISQLQLTMDGYEFCSEIIIKARQASLTLYEVPVFVRYNAQSMRKGQGLFTGIRTLMNLFHHLLTRS